jgi:hypothetical protein
MEELGTHFRDQSIVTYYSTRSNNSRSNTFMRSGVPTRWREAALNGERSPRGFQNEQGHGAVPRQNSVVLCFLCVPAQHELGDSKRSLTVKTSELPISFSFGLNFGEAQLGGLHHRYDLAA